MSAAVIIFGPNLRTQSETFHVHAQGCADTRKALYRGSDGGWKIDAASVQEVVEAIYGDIIAEHEGCADGWDTWEPYADDVRIFPCVKGIA